MAMSPLTSCEVKQHKTPCAVQLRSLIRFGLWAAFAAALGLMHVYVKFATADRRTATSMLQNVAREVENQVAKTRSEVAELEKRDGQYDQRLARELDMRMAARDEIRQATVPVELAARYAREDWRIPERQRNNRIRRSFIESLDRMVAVVAEQLGGQSAYAADSDPAQP